MKSKIITAVFKGQNGSCGYSTNKRYVLKISNDSKNKNILIHLVGEDDRGNVEYESIFSFLENWDMIRVMNQ